MRPDAHHTLTTAAKILEAGGRNHDLIEHVHSIARAMNKRRFDKFSAEDRKRIERQRTLFAFLSSCNATDRLKAAMLQRAYDILWDGDAMGCDALLEFLPEKEADQMLDAWSDDQEGKKPLSRFYEPEDNR